VLGVYTAADLRRLGMRPRFGPAYRDQSVLADAKTIYAGEPVAAVVAEDPACAEEVAGRIEIRRCRSVCDAGRALNPEAVQQQIVGGTVMQLGQTLAEEVRYEGGQALGASLLEYAVPTCGDVPAALEVEVVEVAQPDGPFGAKGVGESATFALSPAVANAVAQATGARLRDLPLTPERVWRGGRAAGGG
jgi:CO/xanthine dehydrogenase Mo-binding subunit